MKSGNWRVDFLLKRIVENLNRSIKNYGPVTIIVSFFMPCTRVRKLSATLWVTEKNERAYSLQMSFFWDVLRN